MSTRINDANGGICGIIAENASDLIAIMSLKGVYSYISPSHSQLGYSPEDLVGRNGLEMIHPDDRKKLLPLLKEYASMKIEKLVKKKAAGAKEKIEFRFPDKKGDWREMEATADLVKSPAGKGFEILVISRDITEKKKVFSSLEESERKFHAIFDNIIDGVVLARTRDKKIYDCNETFARMLGHKAERVKELNVDDLHPESSLPHVHEVFKKQAQGKITLAKDLPIKRKDGSVFYADVNSSRIDIGGERYLMGIFHDTTERVEAEKELQALKQQIEYILGATKTGLDIIDADYNVRYIDPAWQKVYGVPKGKKCYRYFMGRNRPCPECGIKEALKTKKTVVTEETLTKENNRPIQVTTIPFQDDNGEWLVAEVNVDITERKKIEEEVERQRALLSNIISNIPHFIFWKDTRSVYLGCNDNFAEVAGVGSPEKIAGKTDYDLPWKKEEAEFFRKCDREVMKTGKPMLNIEEPQLQADGKEATLLTSKVPLKDDSGKIFGMLGIYADITDIKTTEQALRESEARYRTIFENTGTATVLIEKDMMISMANAELEKILGYRKKEVEGKMKVLDFVDKDHVQRVKEFHRLRRIDPASAPRNYEVKVKSKKGETLDVYLTVGMIPGTDRSVASILDITELKDSESQLKKQKELLNNTNKALEHKLKELQEAAGHIKRLEGLVPICVNCKKMRLEGGDPKDPKAWVSLERYLSEHTEASLTHGLCPECVKKMYGEAFKSKKEE